MAERYAKMNKEEIRELLEQHQKYSFCLYDKTIKPFALVRCMTDRQTNALLEIYITERLKYLLI